MVKDHKWMGFMGNTPKSQYFFLTLYLGCELAYTVNTCLQDFTGKPLAVAPR